MLIAYLFLFVGQVKSEDTDEEVQVICPDGWVAYRLHFYACHLYGNSNWIENCSTCLTCQRNSMLYHKFNIVEFCVVFRPDITRFKYYIQPVQCNENICKILYYHLFCGMELTLSNHRITSQKVLFCQNIHPETQNNTLKSVDLICPRSSSFESLFERNSTYYNIHSFCVLCHHNSAIGTSGKPLIITMCSPHYYPEENKIFSNAYKNLRYCQNTETTRCPPDTIPPIQKGLHCGSKFTASKYGDQVNISNYIPCDNGKSDPNLVKLTNF
jgi:hypothetical protein